MIYELQTKAWFSGSAMASLSGPNYNGVDVVNVGDMNDDGIPEVGSGEGIGDTAWLHLGWSNSCTGWNLGSTSSILGSSSSSGGESVGNVTGW